MPSDALLSFVDFARSEPAAMPLKDNLWRDTVSCLTLRDALRVGPTTSIREVVDSMQRNRVGCVMVCEGEKLSGVFTERDLLRRVLGERRKLDGPISTVMTPDPETATNDETVGSVMLKMREGGYRHLPVVDADGRITGRISVREIVHYMVEHFPNDVYTLPPRPGQVQTTREGA